MDQEFEAFEAGIEPGDIRIPAVSPSTLTYCPYQFAIVLIDEKAVWIVKILSLIRSSECQDCVRETTSGLKQKQYSSPPPPPPQNVNWRFSS